MSDSIETPSGNLPGEELTIAYDADIVAAFRATGDGWEQRVNDALRVYLKEHPLATN
ncbi:uncharacterized protein (DUF4415 family) [Burkholderia ambifaria]|nr:BrnA antitoxin family protein [Burkholderia ambifaria]MDR6503547.1 uncharacterized protein (DUF4415 family) [Burkholderia ambifaria]